MTTGASTITIAASSTDVESGTTTTTTTTLPPEVLDLPNDERNVAASGLIIKNNPSLRDVQDQLPNSLDPLLTGKEDSSIIRKGPVINIFNISGPNARVYIESQDRSANIATITPEEIFNEIREKILANIEEGLNRSEMLAKVNELQETKGTSSFVKKYSEFVALAADHITLFAPILPALTQWLTG
jgi:hypothetical protein